ncbi:hypothetical protein [Kribbella catacumbae]|uniref:hypothetical protein n=1 Tax=Kribbella catacumbae TaxID=460086 RepID=UPI000379CD7E|nr:hypothetical protein [Kribbella catacumbae]
MVRLSEITFRLPASPESSRFLGELRTLLAQVAYAEFAVSEPGRAVDRLTLTPPRPFGARPVTRFELADVPAPEVAFDTGRTISVWSDDTADRPTPSIEMADLTHRLSGHVQRVDHTGVNLPGGATSPEQWRELVGALASAATMYRYPSGEQWPFVLPSSADELRDDIRDFAVGREPRFELVYDQWLTQTEWQFALWTDLTRAELELLFPEPDGITFPDLEEIFRVVAIRHPWPGLGIRFDLCYRIEDGPSDWETGEWLVTEGGRIR